jgi:hypothetical protein
VPNPFTSSGIAGIAASRGNPCPIKFKIAFRASKLPLVSCEIVSFFVSSVMFGVVEAIKKCYILVLSYNLKVYFKINSENIKYIE